MPLAMPSAEYRQVSQPALTLFLAIVGLGTLFWVGAAPPSHRAMHGHRLAPPPVGTPAPIQPSTHARQPPVLPRYPAISQVTARASELNGVPVLTQSFLCSDPAADIMDYYLRQLASRGWEDQTEAFFKITPCLSDRALDPQEQQEVAEKYDFTRATQAVFAKPGESLNISIEPQPGGRSKVNLSWAGTPDLVGFWRKILSAAPPTTEPQQWFQAITGRGPKAGRLQFFRSAATPDEMVATLTARMRREGWTPELPEVNAATGEKTCIYLQGDRWAFVAARSVRSGETTAVLAEQ